MNEKIKELANESGLPTYNPEGVPTKLEKFAELIVRECAELAGCNAHVSGFALGDLIKEHFGIE